MHAINSIVHLISSILLDRGLDGENISVLYDILKNVCPSKQIRLRS